MLRDGRSFEFQSAEEEYSIDLGATEQSMVRVTERDIHHIQRTDEEESHANDLLSPDRDCRTTAAAMCHR